jgi:aspartate kinase
MRVFKFGGASVKNADAVRNVGALIEQYRDQPLIIVISAMGKTTNLLEAILEAYRFDKANKSDLLEEMKNFHFDLLSELLEEWKTYFYEIDNLFVDLECQLDSLDIAENYNFAYDQIVSFGELISTKIVSTYLNHAGTQNRWIDARNFIITTNQYRRGRVNWQKTGKLISRRLKPLTEKQITITQGFIARSEENQTSTLGREGSDYSAAILAYCLDAESVTIWKDVPGIMNADPKRMQNATLLPQLNYKQSIELAYYGASVIHPKTLQPLEQKGIPLYVKSFVNPKEQGTVVNSDPQDKLNVPCYIFKEKQALVSLSTKDFSFVVEDNLSSIFNVLSDFNIQLNLMQNSAISFSLLVNDHSELDQFEELMKSEYKVTIKHDVKLVTIFNFDEDSFKALNVDGELVMEQRSDNVWQRAFM